MLYVPVLSWPGYVVGKLREGRLNVDKMRPTALVSPDGACADRAGGSLEAVQAHASQRLIPCREIQDWEKGTTPAGASHMTQEETTRSLPNPVDARAMPLSAFAQTKTSKQSSGVGVVIIIIDWCICH